MKQFQRLVNEIIETNYMVIYSRLVTIACRPKAPKSFFKLLYYFEILLSRTNAKVKLSSVQDDFFVKESKDNLSLSWEFPNSLRRRGYKYNRGLFSRGEKIAAEYCLANIEFNANDIILDIGANLGNLFIFFHGKSLAINYHAIEPGYIEFKTLCRNLKNNSLSTVTSSCHPIALGNFNGESTFFYSPETADSSVIKPKKFMRSDQIEVSTLDSFIIKNNLYGKKIKLVKLEAEGFEPEIVEGASSSLENIEYIAADLGPERGISEECTLIKVSNMLYQKGFIIEDFSYPRVCILFKNTLFK